MSVHDEIQELIPALALGALDADEATRAKAHLASCAECSRVLDEYRPIADSLAYAAPIVRPPRELKTRTLQRVLQSGSSSRARPVVDRPRRWWSHLGLAPVLAGAALVIALIALGWNIWQMAQLNQQLAAQRNFMTFIAYAQGNALVIHGTERAPGATGRLYIDPDTTIAELVTINMPTLDTEHVYQVWLTEPNGRKTSGGTFRVDSSGSGWLWVHAPQQLSAYTQVGVTVEPRSGSAAPTTEAVLLAEITAQ